MRVRLRPALHYAPVRDGVYFGASVSSFVLRGPQALFRVVDVCVPLLEEGATEDTLVAALGGERARPVVRRVWETLRQHGLLIDLDALTVPEPAAPIRERYREVLADLETLHDDPYAAFARLTAATVLVSGPPEAVLPAARGLARTGIGHLVLAVPDPEAIAATARRLGAQCPALSPDGVPVRADAAIVCGSADTLDTLLERQAKQLPGGCPLVPVRLGERVHLAGPAPVGPADRAGALATRLARWTEAAHSDGPLARPAADALAGALAAQLVYRLLSDTSTTSTDPAHVVYGGTLTADRLDLSIHRPGPPATTLDEAVQYAQSLGTRWTGPIDLVTPADLPQLPLVVAEVVHRDGPAGSVAAWGDDQRSATVAATLAALREQSDGDTGPGAAGLTEERWLLDGALRLLAGQAEPASGAPDFDTLDKAARILWRTLEDHEFVPVALDLLRVPGVAWPMGRVTDAATGTTLATAWAPDAPRAARAALSTALCRVQTRRVRGTDLVGEAPDTTMLLLADDAEVAALSTGAVGRLRPRGARAHDPVLGAQPLWYGPVNADVSPEVRR